jgi:hypothetical protein
MAQPLPQELSQLVALNTKYGILICLGNGCHHAQKPGALSRHLEIKHKTPLALRKQLDSYIMEFPSTYDYASVQLPADGLAPQAIIPIVDGFQCRECAFKTSDHSNIRKHANKVHNKKRVADEDIFRRVRLQSWFGERRERYWVVDESQQARLERQAQRATIQDVGEELDDLGTNAGNTGNASNAGDSSGDSSDDAEQSHAEMQDIMEEIENWEAEAMERQWRATINNIPAAELDSWLQFTEWPRVLGQSKHDYVETYQFARPPDADDEPDLEWLLRAWSRILDRCLDTLAASDQKDMLKWWASPKLQELSQRPYGLPQSAATIDKYSKVWERLICYMMRMAPLEHWGDETGKLTATILLF